MVKIYETETGIVKSESRILQCKNEHCLHYMPKQPPTWCPDYPDKVAAYIKRLEANKLHDIQQRREAEWQSITEAKDDRKPALDAAGAKVRSVEKLGSGSPDGQRPVHVFGTD